MPWPNTGCCGDPNPPPPPPPPPNGCGLAPNPEPPPPKLEEDDWASCPNVGAAALAKLASSNRYRI